MKTKKNKVIWKNTSVQSSQATEPLIVVDSNQKLDKIKRIILLATGLSIFTTLLIALLVNYLVYSVHENSPNYVGPKYIVSEHVAPFTVAMIFVGIIILLAIFLILSSRKRFVVDTKKGITKLAIVGFAASFGNVIFVGSYGVTMGLNKAFKVPVETKNLPGTMTLGYSIPQLLESTIFLGALEFDVITLVTMTVSCIVGGILGAWVSKYVNNQVFRLFMGLFMFIIGIVMILVHPQVNVIKNTLELTKLSGWRLGVGMFVYLFIGCASAMGLGVSAPSLAALTLLGIQIQTIIVIMSVAASSMMPFAALQFFKNKNYDHKTALMYTLGGVWGTLSSFLIVFVGLQMGANINWDQFTYVLKWIAVAVIFYGSFMMLFDFGTSFKKNGWKDERQKPALVKAAS